MKLKIKKYVIKKLCQLILSLPYPVLMYLGTKLSKLIPLILAKRVYIARRNIELVFPKLSIKEQEKIIQEMLVHVGKGLFDIGIAWFWPLQRMEKLLFVEGIERFLKEAEKKENGFIIILPHFISLELASFAVGAYSKGNSMYLPSEKPLMEAMQVEGRTRYPSIQTLVSKYDIKKAIKILKNKGNLFYLPDQDLGYSGTIFAPFLGVEQVACIKATRVLVKASNAKVVMATMKRLENNKGYTISLDKPIASEEFTGRTELEATMFLNKLLEDKILANKSYYLWLHRRFKTRPEGVASRYE